MNKAILLFTMAFVALFVPEGTRSATGTGTGTADSNPETIKSSYSIANYLLSVLHAKQTLVAMLRVKAENAPHLQQIYAGTVVRFDVSKLAHLISIPYSKTMSQNEAAACVSLIGSQTGRELLSLNSKASTADDLIQLISKLPPNKQNAIDAFFNMACMQKFFAFFASNEGKVLMSDFGTNLVCEYASETDKNKLHILRQHGKCLTFSKK